MILIFVTDFNYTKRSSEVEIQHIENSDAAMRKGAQDDDADENIR